MLVHYGPNTRDLFDVYMLSSISKQVAAHYERRADPNSCEALYVLDWHWQCNTTFKTLDTISWKNTVFQPVTKNMAEITPHDLLHCCQNHNKTEQEAQSSFSLLIDFIPRNITKMRKNIY